MIEAGDIQFPRRTGLLRSLWRNTRHSLQFKISLLVVLMVLAIVGAGTATALRSLGEAMFASQLDLARQWGTSLAAGAADALATADDGNSLDHLERTTRILTRWRAVSYIAFADAQSRVIASAETDPGMLAELLPPDGKRLNTQDLNDPRLVRTSDRKRTTVEVVTPVYARPNHRDASGIVGYVLLGTDASVTQARFNRIANRLLTFDLITVMLAIPMTFLLTRHIVAPLNQLARTARALANGVMDARAPVKSHNEIGQLATSFNLMANRITQTQMELLQLAAELEQRVEQRTRELEDLASKDPLTGLYNRRHFSEVMGREFAAAERYGSDLTCLMFDLDHFKQINDRLGHRAGDEALIGLAQAITSELRSSDIAARFGGDEFILLLPQTSAMAARTLADRVTRAFTRLATEKFPAIPAGLSIGIASLSGTRINSAEALINEADKALYAAKARGRGCMVEASAAAN